MILYIHREQLSSHDITNMIKNFQVEYNILSQKILSLKEDSLEQIKLIEESERLIDEAFNQGIQIAY